MNKISKGFFLGSIAIGLGIADVLMIIGTIKAKSGDSDALGMIGLSYIPMLYGAVVMLMLYHKMWASIQDGHARTTPGRAVGMLFVPFYNLYWAFQVIWGFSKDYNAYVERHGTKAARLPEELFLANVIMCFLTWIPVIGLIILVVNYFIVLVMVTKICDAINTTTEISTQTDAAK